MNDRVSVTVFRMGFVESFRRGLPLWRRWHWSCTCGLTDDRGFRDQSQVKQAMIGHIDTHRTSGSTTR